MSNEQYDLFFSYARIDKERTEMLRQRMAAAGRSIFVDSAGIEGGADFPSRLHTALQRSSLVLCCWTPASFRSEWCLHEARYARKRSKLVPVVLESLEAVDLPPDLEFANYFDLSDWKGAETHAGWQALTADILRRLPSPYSTLDAESAERIQYILGLPKKLEAAFLASDDLLAGSTSDMVDASMTIVEGLKPYWVRLQYWRTGGSIERAAAEQQFDAYRQRTIEQLPPRDPLGGTIQRIEAAFSVLQSMAGLIEQAVADIWPKDYHEPFDSWLKQWRQRL